MKPDLMYMNKHTGLEYLEGKHSIPGQLYVEPDTVDMVDILSVHGDEDTGNRQKNAENTSWSVSSDSTLIRDGFLWALKHNLSNVGGRLRYAYLTDEDARQRHTNYDVVKNLRKIKVKAEQIYQNVGGDKISLMKAILTGTGNTGDNRVPFYDAGQQEYGHSNMTSNAGKEKDHPMVFAIVTALAKTLRQLSGLFIRDKKAEAGFQCETNPTESISYLGRILFSLPGGANAPIENESGDFDMPAMKDRSVKNTLTGIPESILTAPRSIMERVIEWIGNSIVKSVVIVGMLIGGGILLKRFLQGERTFSF